MLRWLLVFSFLALVCLGTVVPGTSGDTFFSAVIGKARAGQAPARVPLLTINGAIGPAVKDYLVTEITRANLTPHTPLIVLTLDTPGGLSSSLRDINQVILDSDIPVACLVHPQGARAASAGTYILYACHIAAMAPATTLGAATPVKITGPTTPAQEDKGEEKTPSAMDKKILNDAIAYMRSLAQLRGRNEKWAELAVTEAATLTADEALQENVINFIVDSPEALLTELDRQQVQVKQKTVMLDLVNTVLVKQTPDWRNKFISTITDPNIAYILMLVGIYGLILEFYSPGIGVAGVIGGICLLIALYAFQLLPVNFVGAGLLLLGICLLIVESIMPSFGIFGIGGLVAFVVGSIFLIDTDISYFQVSLPLIISIAIASGLFFIFVLGFLWRSRRSPVVSGQEQMLGADVIVVDDFTGQGEVIFGGEHWAAQSEESLSRGQVVGVSEIKGLTLMVKAKKEDN
ncbi:NfeD family protein [Thalassomonas haliotis]|uniref:Nodulation protein NfeD n=1 Tax=Thalassomonas haliotis TaxID=485448 RepID=A0ABY7VI51_9GAMM|nr:nodulation protein NfeD [Thalassomonas haliotis]WDE13412.1 nodulation protein NfeD [Thalassomonas haliotis]